MGVALYARNSKAPQGWKPSQPGEEAPGSWRLQLQALHAWAAREGHEVALAEYDLVTGGNPNRPGWNKVMAAARGHHIHLVAAVKLDRVMRSTLHFHQVANELLELGVDLVAVDQGVRVSNKDPMSTCAASWPCLPNWSWTWRENAAWPSWRYAPTAARTARAQTSQPGARARSGQGTGCGCAAGARRTTRPAARHAEPRGCQREAR